MIKKALLVIALIAVVVFAYMQTAIADSQIIEGVKKIITAPLEIPKNIVENFDEHGPAALITGTVEGTVEGVVQIVDGTEDVVTAPVNEDFVKEDEEVEVVE